MGNYYSSGIMYLGESKKPFGFQILQVTETSFSQAEREKILKKFLHNLPGRLGIENFEFSFEDWYSNVEYWIPDMIPLVRKDFLIKEDLFQILIYTSESGKINVNMPF